ncbi:MAG TPA: DUF883 C-terminal domain-containing protein [Syntrophorhabdaceae bacterium]|nr:DUF883 C-terminal domain-containing protein [Syntrophorhabdaceae bacterium]
METYNENDEVTESNEQTSGESRCLWNVKNILADKLHCVAEAMGKTTSSENFQEGVCRFGQQACEWLDDSADRIRRFDYRKADSHIRNYVSAHPAASLLIAGAVGMAGGLLLRRR